MQLRRVHRGGSPLPMNPPRSFKFRFKISGICRMGAHCVRARFRDRSRPCFIACACDVHATFKHLIVAERARPCSSGPGELLTALSRRGQCGSFKFRFKISGICRMGAHCVRARFRDRSRPCFIACACEVHASKGYRPYVHETSYLLAFAWLQVTRSARGPGGPRADRVTCNHAKANSYLSSAQGRYLACFTRSRYEHKMRSNLAPWFTLTFQFEDVMC